MRAFRGPERRPHSVGAAIAATAVGAAALGGLAIGALAVRRVRIRRLLVERATFDSLEIGTLTTGERADELVTTTSAWGPAETVGRLEAAIRAKGNTLFGRIDHSGGAAAAGLPLRFTQVLIFGNPRAGTLLMQSGQAIGIDLPLRILVWEHADGSVRVGYRSPLVLVARHGIRDRDDVAAGMSAVLASLVEAVATSVEGGVS